MLNIDAGYLCMFVGVGLALLGLWLEDLNDRADETDLDNYEGGAR